MSIIKGTTIELEINDQGKLSKDSDDLAFKVKFSRGINKWGGTYLILDEAKVFVHAFDEWQECTERFKNCPFFFNAARELATEAYDLHIKRKREDD